MNPYKNMASGHRVVMQIKGAMTSDNPYHNQHIEDFCNYADYVAKGEAEEVLEQVPAIVQQEMQNHKVQVEIDKQSVKKAKAVFDDFAKYMKNIFK